MEVVKKQASYDSEYYLKLFEIWHLLLYYIIFIATFVWVFKEESILLKKHFLNKLLNIYDELFILDGDRVVVTRVKQLEKLAKHNKCDKIDTILAAL